MAIPTTRELVGFGVTAVVMLYGAVLMVKPWLFRPSTTGGMIDGPDRDRVVSAEAVVQRGTQVVMYPFALGIFVGTLLAMHAAWMTLPVTIACAALVMAYRHVATRRWWQWALRQHTDLAMVCELAEDARLVAPDTSWLGRRQRATWMRFPVANAAAALPAANPNGEPDLPADDTDQDAQ